MSLIKLSIKLFPARDSLVSGIPAGDGKIAKLFYSVECSPVPRNCPKWSCFTDVQQTDVGFFPHISSTSPPSHPPHPGEINTLTGGETICYRRLTI
jgi:hypothetical protein